eukprot:TRINITY_DN10546_c0_g1_i2.p1 TRINITY_DN10546_c0_g1~~TRINITY_DN10546_c0_g1_i2.p1  ORF type:complete len:528 (+),score=120.51 TRINITY_DN10546_c0_g1_i2:70-1653(+)
MRAAAAWAGALACAAAAAAPEAYSESVELRPVVGGRAHIMFNLSVSAPWEPCDAGGRCSIADGVGFALGHVYRLFPMQFAQLAAAVRLRRLRFTLTRGRWLPDQWGSPAVPAPGAGSLAAAFATGTGGGREAPPQWKELVDAAAGLFCASLGFLSPDAEPAYARGALLTGPTARHAGWDVWGFLPAEEQVCTENLTPLLALLPGLASVLAHPTDFFATPYHSLVLDFEVAHGRGRLSVIAEAVAEAAGPAFTLSSALSAAAAPRCVLCAEPPVAVVRLQGDFASSERAGALRLLPAEGASVRRSPGNGDTVATFSPAPGGVGWEWSAATPTAVAGGDGAAASVTPFCTDWGDASGTLAVDVSVQRFTTVLRLVLPLPLSTVRPHLHSLAFCAPGGPWRPLAGAPGAAVQYSRAVDTLIVDIELALSLAPGERVLFRVFYDKPLLGLDEYPPDANRLYLLPSPVLWVTAAGERIGPVHATGFATLTLPTPDFSMPFNVVTLACTAVALLFGAVFNFTTRDMVGAEEQG